MRTGSKSAQCAEQAPAEAALAEAYSLCRQRRVRLTDLRRRLLGILLEQPRRPLGAYPLMRRLEALSGRHATAASVYRALEFLQRHDLAIRVESRNAYLACPNPGRPFTGVLFICDLCGVSVSEENPAVMRRLDQTSGSLGFSIRRQVVELQGVCARCSAID
ncbi:MAG: transcriptional repressor [Proteobacteria bacterium]|nr:transcriptional repressor [Pseudomonadota bacterium]